MTDRMVTQDEFITYVLKEIMECFCESGAFGTAYNTYEKLNETFGVDRMISLVVAQRNDDINTKSPKTVFGFPNETPSLRRIDSLRRIGSLRTIFDKPTSVGPRTRPRQGGKKSKKSKKSKKVRRSTRRKRKQCGGTTLSKAHILFILIAFCYLIDNCMSNEQIATIATTAFSLQASTNLRGFKPIGTDNYDQKYFEQQLSSSVLSKISSIGSQIGVTSIESLSLDIDKVKGMIIDTKALTLSPSSGPTLRSTTRSPTRSPTPFPTPFPTPDMPTNQPTVDIYMEAQKTRNIIFTPLLIAISSIIGCCLITSAIPAVSNKIKYIIINMKFKLGMRQLGAFDRNLEGYEEFFANRWINPESEAEFNRKYEQIYFPRMVRKRDDAIEAAEAAEAVEEGIFLFAPKKKPEDSGLINIIKNLIKITPIITPEYKIDSHDWFFPDTKYKGPTRDNTIKTLLEKIDDVGVSNSLTEEKNTADAKLKKIKDLLDIISAAKEKYPNEIPIPSADMSIDNLQKLVDDINMLDSILETNVKNKPHLSSLNKGNAAAVAPVTVVAAEMNDVPSLPQIKPITTPPLPPPP